MRKNGRERMKEKKQHFGYGPIQLAFSCCLFSKPA
jgi:hypothetical protein